MWIRLFLALGVVLGAAWSPAIAQSSTGKNAIAAAVPPRHVMTWVAPYAISTSLARLKTTYSGVGPKNSLTHLALQFWTPRTFTPPHNILKRSAQANITNATIKTFVDWGHANGIKVVLCVFNGDAGWDWALAKQAFKDHRTDFINALINEMQARNLDGIDVDLEGVGDFEADKGPFVAFVKELARRAHLVNKIVTVDSFPYKWNAPNWNWWPALFPYVDGITSMGYAELGLRGNGWQKYLVQKNRAGTYSAKLQIGVPADMTTWLGNTTLQQLQWFRTAEAGRVGISIWDAQFPDASWKSAPVWNVLKAVRQN